MVVLFLHRPPGAEKRERVAATHSPAWVIVVAVIGSSMTFIDSTAANVALPAIARDLRADAANLPWVIEGYALFLSALILIGGSLGDVFGRRRIFVGGIALFAVASVGCAVAPTILALNIARCLQGVGAALSTPGSLALISANFQGVEKGRAIGSWSGFASITAALGPLLGGWLTQHASWRYVFIINVPLAAFVIGATLLRVPESRAGDTESVDVPGAFLATLALGALTFGLIRLQTGTPYTFGLAAIAAGVLLLVAFAAWQRRARFPMIPLHIFADRVFSGANLYTLFLYAALGGGLYFVPIDLQVVHGYLPTAAGAAMLPFIVIMFVLSRWSGGLVGTVGARVPLIAGAVIAGLGFLAYARIGVAGSYGTTFLPAAVLLGVGGALFVAPLTTTVMEAIDASHAGIASGINNAVSRVASLLAVAALSSVLLTMLYARFDRLSATLALSGQTHAVLNHERGSLGTGIAPSSLGEPDRERVEQTLKAAYTSGFQVVMVICAALAILSAVIAGVTIPKRNTNSAQAKTAIGSAGDEITRGRSTSR